MKKYFLIFLNLLLISPLFAQKGSGEITYQIKPPENVTQFIDTTGQVDSFKDWIFQQYGEIKKTAPYLKFELKFDQKEALFDHSKTMVSDSGMDLEFVAEASGAAGKYYSNMQENLNLHQFKYNNKIWIVKTALDKLDWEIGKEIKKIQGYTCKKATAISDYTNNFKNDTEITAWFCPELPFQYGPRGITGLPGIILELEYNHYTYTAEKVELSENEDAKIKRPKKGKILTQDEYFEELKKAAPPPPRPKR